MDKPSNNNYPVNNLIMNRWSPRAFSNQLVEKEKIFSILEAARWAPSAFNEQPWRFIVGQNGDEAYNKIFGSLVEWNQQWAKSVPVLILNIAKKTFTHNGTQNVTFKYDLGQAVGQMILEVVNQGLVSHQMTGFDPDKAAAALNVPDDFQVVSVTAIGYQGEMENLPEQFAKIEVNKRERKDLDTIAFKDKFGVSL